MQSSKLKVVTVKERKYQLRKMEPFIGSHIWNQLLRASLSARMANSEEAAEADTEQSSKEASAEERIAGLASLAFMYMDKETHVEVQKECMRAVAELQQLPEGGGEAPMPVMADNGRWASQQLAADLLAQQQLVIEVLKFNLACFLE